ncbi:MAG: MBL fold metallo-hydrolase [Clostridia bacterium]|nr:MBL fold metallo-hydrolase [Clostridia bacterium]
MKITFLGAAHEVTGSCTLIEAAGKNILVDFGMEQGIDTYENYDIPVIPGNIDAVFLTHAHIDHSGKIPALVKNGFRGNIYATFATYRLCEIMLRDSAHIQESEAEWQNRKAARRDGEQVEPLYNLADVEATLKLFKTYHYGESFEVFDGVSATFSDAGHLLGSSSILLKLREGGTERSVLFSGDLGNVTRPLIRDPEGPMDADFVVIESTYGDRLHGERPDYESQMTRIIQSTLDRGGNVVIPSFAVGRTQELLYLIRRIKEEGRIKGHDGFPVYVDSPLAVEATNVYSASSLLAPYYDKETTELLSAGKNPILFPGLRLSVTSDESKLINTDITPKVIISASGMCEAGRIRHHLKHNLWREESTVLFVGYQSEGTVGRRIINREKCVRLFNEEIAVKCHVETLAGISGHADRDMLLSWLSSMKTPARKVFVNHGDDKVCESFATLITESRGIFAEAPYSGDVFDLETGECIERGEIVRVSKKKQEKAQTKNSGAYNKLLEAFARLADVVTRYRQASVSDISNLTGLINSLMSKIESGKGKKKNNKNKPKNKKNKRK